ncbi:hypothetical protein AUC68_04505 [Methyloceanibacter methanicus]|uniref:Inner membrane protein YgaP-like transmembrane domain-containing protein n=1 Tax=Methyloceanibacter methanicus TaxID=1774968 RepID=A0A1E3W0D7_9HYPH|nr:DUF2892 domain-containing protein [Methyloceanibacter methanicus]ODR99268.1 hypothetical protein AUC68_04505 [Methyloceanibacter methanicus]
MTANVGTIDRIIRAALGVALLWFAFFSGLPLADTPLWKYGAAILGVVMLVVAAVRVCPVYSIFGLKTCA